MSYLVLVTRVPGMYVLVAAHQSLLYTRAVVLIKVQQSIPCLAVDSHRM